MSNSPKDVVGDPEPNEWPQSKTLAHRLNVRNNPSGGVHLFGLKEPKIKWAEYTVSASRKQVRKSLSDLPESKQFTATLMSLCFWRLRLREAWETDWHNGHRTSLSHYALKHSRQGSGKCTRQWGCCNFCDHNNSFIFAAKFLRDLDGPRQKVTPYTFTFSGINDDLKPGALLKAAKLCLDLNAGARAKSHPSICLLTPSLRSSDPGLNGRPHIHVIPDQKVNLPAIDSLAKSLGMSRSPSEDIGGDPDSLPRFLAYLFDQMTEDVTKHHSFAHSQSRAMIWKRHHYSQTRLARRKNYAAAIEAMHVSIENHQERFRKGKLSHLSRG